jgi:hypothetical protein
LLQTKAVRLLGAPFVSTLMPSRLVVAMIAGSLVLGEVMNALQIIGAAIVITAVTCYLLLQQRDKAAASRRSATESGGDGLALNLELTTSEAATSESLDAAPSAPAVQVGSGYEAVSLAAR